MSRRMVEVIRAGPSTTVQDRGRIGLIGAGLSPGGAVDRSALLEGHALVGNPLDSAALEMAGMGAAIRVSQETWVALTGAEMRGSLDGVPMPHRATLRAAAGSVIDIGPAVNGVYGYLHLSGGIAIEPELGGRGFHGIGGIGSRLRDGERLPLGSDDQAVGTGVTLPNQDVRGGPIRVMSGPQTESFSTQMRGLFEETMFTRSPRGNRQGVRFDHDGAAFSAEGQLSLVSDFIREGDIQMTGNGTPFVLLADCQTMGGYPRIGTVLSADLSRLVQVPPGETVRFRFVSLEEAEAAFIRDEDVLASLKAALVPLKRDPRKIGNLLDYDLIAKPIQGD